MSGGRRAGTGLASEALATALAVAPVVLLLLVLVGWPSELLPGPTRSHLPGLFPDGGGPAPTLAALTSRRPTPGAGSSRDLTPPPSVGGGTEPPTSSQTPPDLPTVAGARPTQPTENPAPATTPGQAAPPTPGLSTTPTPPPGETGSPRPTPTPPTSTPAPEPTDQPGPTATPRPTPSPCPDGHDGADGDHCDRNAPVNAGGPDRAVIARDGRVERPVVRTASAEETREPNSARRSPGTSRKTGAPAADRGTRLLDQAGD